jgi:hypothetical protein
MRAEQFSGTAVINNVNEVFEVNAKFKYLHWYVVFLFKLILNFW